MLKVVLYIATPRGPRYPGAPPATTSEHEGTAAFLPRVASEGLKAGDIESKPEFHPSMKP
jgi:hypothetical protein